MNENLKTILEGMYFVKKLSNYFWNIRPKGSFIGSEEFWRERYHVGGNSGPGSYGQLGEFKSNVINEFLGNHEIKNVIDFGCGDGNQIKNIAFPNYLGFDISNEAINHCNKLYKKSRNYKFKQINDYGGERADLVISLDVIFHLVEDAVYNEYMERLLSSAKKYIIIYSSDYDQICLNPFSRANQVRHRKFSSWIKRNANEFKLYKHVENRFSKMNNESAKTHSHSDFYIYKNINY